MEGQYNNLLRIKSDNSTLSIWFDRRLGTMGLLLEAEVSRKLSDLVSTHSNESISIGIAGFPKSFVETIERLLPGVLHPFTLVQEESLMVRGSIIAAPSLEDPVTLVIRVDGQFYFSIRLQLHDLKAIAQRLRDWMG